MRTPATGSAGAASRVAVVVLVALVAGCSFGPPSPGSEPSPTVSAGPPPRYEPMDKEFCVDSGVHEVPERLGLTNEMSDSDTLWSYTDDAHADTGLARWYWTEIGCRYEAYAEEGDDRWFTPRGVVTVTVFSDSEPAYDHYMSEVERRLLSFTDPEISITQRSVDGWWDEGTRLERLDTSTSWTRFGSEYHLYHDNLYVSVPLVSEVDRDEELEAVTGRAHELLEALIAELIAHIPLASGQKPSATS